MCQQSFALSCLVARSVAGAFQCFTWTEPVLIICFSRGVLQALLASPPADPDAASRVDLTHLSVYTIDDASTRDVDDGISVEQAEDGQLLLWVHVADPTRWLQPGASSFDSAL